jgi:hypothetical protein
MHLAIPVWFYGFDALMYFLSSIVGFLLSFYFNRIYSLSSEKRHMYLYLGFMMLSVALLGLSITDSVSYATFMNCHDSCVLGLMDDAFSLEDFSYFIYFGLSLCALLMFMLAYIPEGFKYSKVLLFGFIGYLIVIAMTMSIIEEYEAWYSYNEYFNFVAFMMMVFITFRNAVNYNEKATLNSFLVLLSFSLITLFYLFHLLSFISGWMYVFAHIALLSGFISLLAMVLRVRKE